MYGSGLMEHDMQVGQLLDKMKAMGVLDNTIIVYSTDNGPEHSARTHGGTTPFRGEPMKAVCAYRCWCGGRATFPQVRS